MEQFFPQNTGIIIIGERPSWYTGLHFYVPDASECPYVNQWNKLYYACNLKEVSPIFIYFDDDFYLNEPFELRHYFNGGFIRKFNHHRHMSGTWAACIRNTYHALPESPDHCLHVPLPIRKRRFLEVADMYWTLCGQPPSIVPRQAYCIHETAFPKLEIRDVKKTDLESVMTSVDPFFSTYEAMEDDLLYQYLESKYPIKSKYESQ